MLELFDQYSLGSGHVHGRFASKLRETKQNGPKCGNSGNGAALSFSWGRGKRSLGGRGKMKQSAQRKRSHISLVDATTEPAESYFYRRTLQPRPTHRLLHVVAPHQRTAPTSTDQLTRNAGIYSATLHRRLPTVTTEEAMQVHLATVRESSRHRYWPSDVVERFMTAEVVRQ